MGYLASYTDGYTASSSGGGGTAVESVDLTFEEITALLEATSVTVTAGLELYDADEVFLADISDDLLDGVVDRGNYRTIHGTCRLRISRELQWGSQRVKPYLTLDDGTNEHRWDLGMFLLSTPERRAGETPATFDVDGYDKLEILNHPHGASYSAAAGARYLTLVEALIADAGETKVRLDQAEWSTTLPTTKVWALGGSEGGTPPTTLKIINDLLSAINYRALWVDRDGYFRSEPYRSPASRGADWPYSADSDSTMVAEDRTASADFFATPNRWVFVRNDPSPSLTFPVEGDGIYTVLNQSDGPTSIDGRGRTITRVESLDAASQATLVSQGDRMVEADRRLDQRLSLSVSPNPRHWHFDVVSVTDAQLGLSGAKYVVTDWSLPLDGSDMTIELKAV